MTWAVVEELDDRGQFLCFHTVPMVTLDGDVFISAYHDLSDRCPCHPLFTRNPQGLIQWWHYDPDHPGALTDEQWEKLKKENS